MKKFFTIFFSLLAGALISAMVFLWLASGEIYDYQDTFSPVLHSKDVDVVLCLAGGKGRIPAAVQLWQDLRARDPKKYPATILFFSGMGPEADRDTLIEQGVPKTLVKSMRNDEVVFEKVSTNTYENTQIFSTYARQHQWKRVVLVTAGYHMKRSYNILHQALGPEVEILTLTVGAEHFDRNGWHKDMYAIRVTMMEYIKWLFYLYSYS